MVDGDFADRRELFVAAFARPDVAWIDPVFVERARAVRVFREQQVAVVVEIADERRRAARVEHALPDFGHRGRGFGQIHGDADHFRSGFRQLDALRRGGARISGVGHRHRLDDDRRAAADLDDRAGADFDANCLVEPDRFHVRDYFS